jgi:uncharacterized protein (DUF39 family)
MSINAGQTSTQLADGNRFYAYSGIVTGDVTVPATITLIDIPNTGLKDAFVKIQPSYGQAITNTNNTQLGIVILIDEIEIIKSQRHENEDDYTETFDLFVPRQARIQILSLNTTANNTQERGVTMLGWRV